MDASRQSFPVSVLISLGLVAGFVARWMVAPTQGAWIEGMPLAAMLTRFSEVQVVWAAIAAAVLVVWTLLLVIQLTLKFGPVAARNYLPSQLFLIAAFGIVIGGEALASLVAAWLMLLAMRGFVTSFHKGFRFSEVFHAGFFLGLVPLLYAPAAVFVVPVAVSALVIYRRGWREAVVCMAAILLPLPAAGLLHWAMGETGGFIYNELWHHAVVQNGALSGIFSGPVVVMSSIVLCFAMAAAVWMPAYKKASRNTPYKLMQHTLVTMVLVVASGILPGSSPSLLPLVAVPCAVAVPFAFWGRGARLSTMLYVMVLAAVAVWISIPIVAVIAG